MSTGGSWATTPAKLERDGHESLLMDGVVRQLKSRGIKSEGIVALPDGRRAHVFAGPKQKVSTVIIVGGPDKIKSLFTRYSVGKNDNFDEMVVGEGRMIPVEPTVFGGGKLLAELSTLDQLLWGDFPDSNTALDVLGNMFAEAKKDPQYQAYLAPLWFAAKMGRGRLLSVQLAMHLMKKHLLSIDVAVCKMAQDAECKIAKEVHGTSKTESLLNDPVVKLCMNRKPLLEAWMSDNSQTKDIDAVGKIYWTSRDDILDVICNADPKVAKLGVGRRVILSCIKTFWDKYALLLVAASRRAMLYADRVQLYTFGMTLWHADMDGEFTLGDDIWGNEVKALVDGMGPLDAFLPSLKVSQDKIWEARMEIVRLSSTEKLLGAANMIVLDSIKKDVMGQSQLSGPLSDPEFVKFVKRMDWEEWFNCNVLRGMHFGVLDCTGNLDAEVAGLLRSTTKGDAEAFVVSLGEELA